MEIMNWQEITMESETFSKIRESFNLLLQRLFQKMEQNHSDEGAITLKVNLSISKDFIPDGNGSSREVHKPVLKYKIDTQVPVKDGFDGKNDTGMELVYDDELKRYVLRYVSEGGQQSIFDPEYANVVNGEATIVDEQPALSMNAPLLECSEQDATEADNSSSDSENTSNEEIIDQDDTNGGFHLCFICSIDHIWRYHNRGGHKQWLIRWRKKYRILKQRWQQCLQMPRWKLIQNSCRS